MTWANFTLILAFIDPLGVIYKGHPHEGREEGLGTMRTKADKGEGGFQGMWTSATYIEQTSKTGMIVPMNCVFSLTVMLTTALGMEPTIYSRV